MNNELHFEDFNERIDIEDLLAEAGYRQNRKEGLKWPVYQRYDGSQRVHGDKFIVTSNRKCCFRPAVSRNYNVVGFIKAFPEMFPDYRPGQSLNSLVFGVCSRMLGTPRPERTMGEGYGVRQQKPFRMEDYDVRHLDTNDAESRKAFDRFFSRRGISHETQDVFKDHFILAARRREDGKSHSNLSFPLRIPGKEGIVGLEERGRMRPDGSGYKGKALGSNGSEGLWIANLSREPLGKVRNVLWFESAYDAMAQYQLEGNGQTRASSAYVSTGGSPTIMQIRGMLAATKDARHYVGFDKDAAGKQFLANFRSIAEDMGIGKERVQANQPLGYYKDWNDALLGKKTMTLKDVSCDYDYGTDPVYDEDKRQTTAARPSFHR